jgi:hypothetical protein
VSDIPALFTQFNAQGIQLYPKLVWVPFEHSLKYADPREIHGAIQQLEVVSLEQKTDIQRFNSIRYAEIVRQLRHWATEAEARLHETALPHDLSALRMRFRETITGAILNDALIGHLQREALLDHAQDVFARLDAACRDDAEARDLYLRLLRLPGYALINEVYRMDAEKLVRRFMP